MKAFSIRGRITDKKSGRGVFGLFVKAFDKEHLYDDLLGEVITDRNGNYEIVYDRKNFRELFFENRPKLYLRVTSAQGKEVLVTKERVRYLADRTKAFDISIAVADLIPRIPEFSIHVIRPEDFLTLHFTFNNLIINDEYLQRRYRQYPAYITVEFPPQNIAEEAFFEVADKFPVAADPNKDVDDNSTGNQTPFFPCQTRLAGPSRLVFKVPEGEKIPYTLEGLLGAISTYKLNLAPTAYPPLLYLHHLIQPQQLQKRVELLDSIDFYKGEITKREATQENDNIHLQDTEAADDWLARTPLKKYLPKTYDKAVRKEIAELFVKARFFIKPELKPPTVKETSIEAPYRLLISPNKYAAWTHAELPVASSASKRTELWHTRYALRLQGEVTEEQSDLKTVRAIWSRDPFFGWEVENEIFPDANQHYDPTQANPALNPFRMSLDAYDRKNIVHLTSNQHIHEYLPAPVDVQRLMLTSFGAWMNVRGAWEPPSQQKLSVEEWRHRATMGRDHYVRVVYKGYLFPFGHRASLIKVTERKFHPQILYFLDFAGMLFTSQMQGLVKGVDNSTRSSAGSFLQGITAQYNSNVGDLVQAISERGVGSVHELLKESGERFRSEIEELVKASGDSTRKQLTSLVDKADKVFKINVDSIADAVKGITAVKVPGNIAWLRQRMYIVVRQPERIYIDSGVDRYNRQMPFSRIAITTLVTPDLNDPVLTQIDGKGQAFFWPKVGSSLFKFHLIGEDFAGNVVDFTAPLIFTESTLLGYKNASGNIVPSLFNASKATLAIGGAAYRSKVRPDFSGQSVMFADSSTDPGKTTFETEKIVFDAEILGSAAEHEQLQVSLGDNDFPQFYPKVSEAKVRIPSIKHLAGNNQATTIQFANTFLDHGFHQTSNKGEVFANLINSVDLDFNSQGDRSGGLAKPNMSIKGLSRLMGPVAGNNLSQLEQGNLDPAEFFGSLDAKIFGVINLWDIIELLAPDDFLDNNGEKLPQLLPKVTKDGVEVGYAYKPELKDWNNLFIASNKGKKAEFELSAKIIAYAAGGADVNIYCGLRNFSIDLIGPLESFIVIHFNQIAFISSGGKKAEVDVDLGEIEFVGILSFVETLKDFIPLDGFSDPPSLDVSEKGITASFSLSLPTVAVGVFSLQNMSLGASFILPFLVDPLSVRFNFCERQSPFLLTVSMFGGGGFFAITVDPAGVQQLEASFEFGASVAVSFGVASGGVYVMAGIYFMMQANPEKAELTGYLRMGGEVDVLGIISVSIELYLSLTYEFSSGKCVGRATLTIEVEVLFFSASVEISCERKFAGSNGDPTFKQLMEPYVDPVFGEEVKPWEEYCQAYA